MKQFQIVFFSLLLMTIGVLSVFGQSTAINSADQSTVNDKTAVKKIVDVRREKFNFSLKKESDEDLTEDYSKEFFDSSKENSAARQANDDPSPISTDRPSFSAGPQIVSTAFKAQIESGYTYTRSGGDKNHALGEILVRVPVAESVELRFGVPSYQFQRGGGGKASGFGDASVGAKIKFTDAAEKPGLFKKPATAVVVSTTLPTGSEAFGSDDLQPQAVFALSTLLVEKIGITSNIGYLRASDGIGNNFNQGFASLLLSRGLTKRLGGYFEVYGQSRVSAASSDGAKYANAGLTYLLNNNSQLDARFGSGLGNHAAGPDYFFGFGYSQRF